MAPHNHAVERRRRPSNEANLSNCGRARQSNFPSPLCELSHHPESAAQPRILVRCPAFAIVARLPAPPRSDNLVKPTVHAGRGGGGYPGYLRTIPIEVRPARSSWSTGA